MVPIHLTEVESLKEGLQKPVNNELFGMIGTLPSVAYAFQNNSISELMMILAIWWVILPLK